MYTHTYTLSRIVHLKHCFCYWTVFLHLPATRTVFLVNVIENVQYTVYSQCLHAFYLYAVSCLCSLQGPVFLHSSYTGVYFAADLLCVTLWSRGIDISFQCVHVIWRNDIKFGWLVSIGCDWKKNIIACEMSFCAYCSLME